MTVVIVKIAIPSVQKQQDPKKRIELINEDLKLLGYDDESIESGFCMKFVPSHLIETKIFNERLNFLIQNQKLLIKNKFMVIEHIRHREKRIKTMGDRYVKTKQESPEELKQAEQECDKQLKINFDEILQLSWKTLVDSLPDMVKKRNELWQERTQLLAEISSQQCTEK